MAIEIERRFRVADPARALAGRTGRRLRQGYLARAQDGATIRIRTAEDPPQAWLTVKGPTHGIARAEFEYPVPAEDAAGLFALCTGTVIDKTRYRIGVDPYVFEVDVFHGDNDGLVLAEVELPRADAPVALPGWLGREVSGDSRYGNAALSLRPWRLWHAEERT